MQLFFIVNLLSAIYLSGKFPIKDLGITGAALRLSIISIHCAVCPVGYIALGGVGGAERGVAHIDGVLILERGEYPVGHVIVRVRGRADAYADARKSVCTELGNDIF